ncbi:MAG: ABC transporter ATP-binding protein [Vampirovibrionales bacterium]|nr:ABC transporter ATP-binding protein [Vampirovibrionales bacterium]
MLVFNAVGMAIPVRIQVAIDGLAGMTPHALGFALAQILALGAVLFCTRLVSRVFLVGVGRRLECDFRAAMFERLLSLPASYHQTHPPGELLSRVSNDAQALRFLTGGGVMMGFNTLFAYAMALPTMWGYSPRLTVLALSLFPLAVLLMSGVNRRVKTYYAETQSHLAQISAVAQENFSAMAVIQTYAKETVEDRRFQRVCRAYLKAFQDLIRARVWLTLIMAMVSSVGVLAVLTQGGWETIAGRMSGGAFLAFLLLLERLSFPTAAMGWVITIFQQGAAAMERMDAILSASAPSHGRATRPYESPFPHGPLEIRRLTFSYHNPYDESAQAAGKRDSRPVLQDVSLCVEPGETIAVVGPLGSGKSTLLQLIAGRYPIEDGAIRIGGRDINQDGPARERLRQAVMLMPQRSFLFSSDIAHNIAYAQPDAIDSDGEGSVVRAARIAAIDAEIKAMPLAYRTIVGERGLTLSGGQRQRLALARSLMTPSRILLLDDPFANVDAHTEADIIDALIAQRVFADKITLIATHRLSIAPRVSRVALMDAGRLLALAPHAQLLEEQPLYRALHRLARLESELSEVWRDAPADESGEEEAS